MQAFTNGEYIEKDMIAVRVSKDHRAAIVGSPAYFKSHPKPKSLSHRCINFRHGSAGIYRWEFDKGKKSLSVAVNGPLIVDDVELLVRASIDGIGLAFMSEDQAAPDLTSGALVRVLEDWCQPFPGFFLYYPSRRQQPAALSALINAFSTGARRITHAQDRWFIRLQAIPNFGPEVVQMALRAISSCLIANGRAIRSGHIIGPPPARQLPPTA
jgi:DNA-binding transcriptional LysR family regulator